MKPIQMLEKLRSAGVKLWLEGGEVHYSAERGSPQINLWLKQLAQHKAELSLLLARPVQVKTDKLRPIPSSTQNIPVSFEQRRFLFLNELEGANHTYNLSSSFSLHGELNLSALCQSIANIVAQHSILNVCFKRSGSDWLQATQQPSLILSVTDIGDLPKRFKKQLTQQLQQSDAQQPFDLINGPHLRVRVIRVSQQEHRLIVVMHHIISDGHSIRIFVAALRQHYLNAQSLSEEPINVPEVQYREYALWQKDYLAQKGMQGDLEYWQQQLKSAPTVLHLDIAKQRPPQQRFSGGIHTFRIEHKQWQAMSLLAKQNELTAFHCWLGVFALTLAQYSGVNDVVIGSPTSRRRHINAEQIIGPFLNMLALRVHRQQGQHVIAYLESIKQMVVAGMDHSMAPFEKVVEALAPQRSTAYTPLFQHMFVLEDIPLGIIQLPGLEIKTDLIYQPSAKYDTTLILQRDERGFFGTIRYNIDLFDECSITQLAASFQYLAHQMSENPGMDINCLQPQSTQQREALLNRFQGKSIAHQGDCCLHQLVERQTAKTPDQIAVQYEGERWTYARLEARSNQYAWWLIEKGVQPRTVVAMAIDESIELVCLLLAIGKSGAVYLPIGKSDPEARVSKCLYQADAEWVVCGLGRDVAQHERYQILDIPDETLIDDFPMQTPMLHVDPSDLVSILYTSGSTGMPKAVMTEHRALVNNLQWMQNNWPLHASDRLLFKSPLTFDVSAKEIIWPLMVGGQLVIARAGGRHDPSYLWRVIRDASVTVAHLVPTMLEYFITESQQNEPLALRIVMCGGEALSLALLNRFHAAFSAELLHLYGPTEAAIAITGCELPRLQEPMPSPVIALGETTDNSSVYVLNQQLQPVPMGVIGELYIGGLAVARGYYGQASKTSHVFLPDPFVGKTQAGSRMYATGDRVRVLTSGELVYVGRQDNQVKLYGQRIELGEIESILEQHAELRDAVVIAVPGPADQPALKAFLTVNPQGKQPTNSELAAFLRHRLASHMLPVSYSFVDQFPKLVTGKIDRKQLKDQASQVEPINVNQPSSRRQAHLNEQRLQTIWCEVLQREQIGVFENFFEAGGHSLLAIELRNRLREVFGVDLAVADIFAHATIEAQAQFLLPETASFDSNEDDPINHSVSPVMTTSQHLSEPIAVIGMAGRFPGADDIDQFWENIEVGKDSVSHFSYSELLTSGCPEELINHPDFVPARAIIDNIENFDATFFGFTPMEASLLDPQHRLLLESAQLAFDDAAYSSQALAEQGHRVAVFVGVSNSSYFEHNLRPRKDLLLKQGGLQLALSTSKSYAATQLAFRLNLKGPAMSVDTACSTSLVAITKACQSLRIGEAELALAGGASIDVPLPGGHVWQEGGVGSKDGHCRPFDSFGTGTVKGMGGGVVLLKLLSAAERDGDVIHAVILGAAVNNDGSNKVGFTAPSVGGQNSVIESALAEAGVAAQSVHFIETHGTGTTLGDPIEINSLASIYNQEKTAIGAIKGNIGHLDAAAGVAGFIKTVLALRESKIPPMANFESFNQQIDMPAQGLRILTKSESWPINEEPRRAAVSSFGIGGTNAHVVLEQAPVEAVQTLDNEQNGPEAFVFSAHSPEALQATLKHFRQTLKKSPSLSMPAVSFTLNCGRKHRQYRQFVIAKNQQDLLEQCDHLVNVHTQNNERLKLNIQSLERPKVAFMFPGQGSSNEKIIRALYDHDQCFTDSLDKALTLLAQHTDFDFKKHINVVTTSDEEVSGLQDIAVAQAWQFAVSMALATFLKKLGICPDICLGHSLGEYAAACMAGVFSIEDGLAILTRRGQLVSQCEQGAMLAISCEPQQVMPWLQGQLEVAVKNSVKQTVVAGPPEQIEQLQEHLRQQKIAHRLLPAKRAFHTTMLASIADQFYEYLTTFEFNPAVLPLLSNVTGKYFAVDEVADAGYWCRHLQETVCFDECIRQACTESPDIFIEIGAGETVSRLASGHTDCPKESCVFSLLPHLSSGHSLESVPDGYLQALAQLWQRGVPLDWQRLFCQQGKSLKQGYRRTRLPGYPFQRTRHWIDAPASMATGSYSSEFESDYQVHSWVRMVLPKRVLNTQPNLIVVHDTSTYAEQQIQLLQSQGIGLKLIPVLKPEVMGDQFDALLGSVSKNSQLLIVQNPLSCDDSMSTETLKAMIQKADGCDALTHIVLAFSGSLEVIGNESSNIDIQTLLFMTTDEPSKACRQYFDLPVGSDCDDIQALLSCLSTDQSGLIAIRHGHCWRPEWVSMPLLERNWQRIIPAEHACFVCSDQSLNTDVLLEHLQHCGAKNIHHYLLSSQGEKQQGFSAFNQQCELLPRSLGNQPDTTLFFILDSSVSTDRDVWQQACLLNIAQALEAVRHRRVHVLVLIAQSMGAELDGLTLIIHRQLKSATQLMGYAVVKCQLWRSEKTARSLLAEAYDFSSELLLSQPNSIISLPATSVASRQQAREISDQPAEQREQASSLAESTLQNSMSELEFALATHWSELLGIELPTAADNFFSLGGDSLMANQSISHIQVEFGVRVAAATFQSHASVAELARVIDSIQQIRTEEQTLHEDKPNEPLAETVDTERDRWEL